MDQEIDGTPTLSDEDMTTTVGGATASIIEPGPRDDTDGDATDGTDGDSGDADGTDGTDADGTDGTDGTDADGTDQ
jgi:hypothetical protein